MSHLYREIPHVPTSFLTEGLLEITLCIGRRLSLPPASLRPLRSGVVLRTPFLGTFNALGHVSRGQAAHRRSAPPGNSLSWGYVLRRFLPTARRLAASLAVGVIAGF